MNNTEHNQKTISDRARLGIAFGAAFIGILIAGLSEHPAVALSGTAQQEADAQSGPGIGLETAGGSQAGPGVSESSAAGPGADFTDPDLQPVIWYNADGIWVYSPQKDESVQLTSYAEGGAPDRMSEVYSETNPADDVVLSADGTLAAYFRRQTMSLFSGTTAELWCTNLSADQHRERKVAENVISFKILPDGSLIWMDADSGFYRLQDPAGAESPARKRIASGVTDFRVSADGADIFYVTDIGTGYALASSEGASPRRIAESVYGIEWASEDLDTIYYNNGDGDMFCINGLRNVQIVDVDIQDFAVIEKTGHLYYLRADEGTEEGETSEESTADDAGAESGEETGSLTTEEEILNLINSIKLENGLTIAEAAESAAAESEAEKAKEDHWETVLPDSRKGRLGYFDGQNHGIVLSGVASINTMNSDSIEQDRLLVTLDLDNDYRIFILRDDVPLDTGMKITDDGLTDLCIDFSRDTLYYIRQSEDEAGSMDRGTVYARDFDEKGFGTERKLFDGATVISAARDGKVYTGAFPDSESGSRFAVDGKVVSEHVSSFWWDEGGFSDTIRLYRNVFQDFYYVSGEFDETMDDGTLRGIAYNVRECHAFDDGSYTFLTNYDEELQTGTLLYWDGYSEHKPVLVSRNAAGTKKGTYE